MVRSDRTRTLPVRNLRQRVVVRATPREIYRALLWPSRHARFTGASARLEPRAGGRFAHYDGSLTGIVVDLEPDRRIVLAWRSSGWPEHHYSIAEFHLTATRAGTRIDFSQFGIPSTDFRDIAEGWKTYYWEPLKAYFEG